MMIYVVDPAQTLYTVMSRGFVSLTVKSHKTFSKNAWLIVVGIAAGRRSGGALWTPIWTFVVVARYVMCQRTRSDRVAVIRSVDNSVLVSTDIF